MIFGHNEQPVFVKEDTLTEQQLNQMKQLRPFVAATDQKKLERDIKLTEAGLYGENRIAYELKSSGLPIHVLRDLRLEHDGISAQIDFLVIGPYVNLVIECKNLIGDIEINERGDFIRSFGTPKVREGIYSPVAQNERHLRVMRSIRADGGNFVRVADKMFFEDMFRSVVVLANPKSVLDDRNAPKAVREQIVRADGLVPYIKKINKGSLTDGRLNARDREHAAKVWLGRHIEKPVDLKSRYKLATDPLGAPPGASGPLLIAPACPLCGRTMVRRTATRGERAGKPFWGCPSFPNCRGIINIDE